MRQDLAKVICEDGRRGPRDYMGCTKGYARKRRCRVAADRDGEHAGLEALPRYESMTERLHHGGRWFSENLGAVRGLISSSCGKPWDTVYGELCRLVSPTGTAVQRHVHQHLDEFLLRRTRMGDAGIECCRSGDGLWRPIAAVRTQQEHFVHPSTGIVTRFTQPRVKRRSQRSAVVLPGPQTHICYIQLSGYWYRFDLEQASYVPRRHGPRHRRRVRQEPLTLIQADRFTLEIARALPPSLFDYRHIPRDGIGASDLQRLRIRIFGADLVPHSKRSLTAQEMRISGISNRVPYLATGPVLSHLAARHRP